MVNNREPLVSVIIPTYNSGRYIKEAIDSVLAQTYKNLEIIVIDDGSMDDTRTVLEQYAGKIKYFYKKNGGPASARNLGIKNSKGEYIAFLDSDDIWLTDKINLQLQEMSPDTGLIGSGTHEGNKSNFFITDITYVGLLIKNAFANSGTLVRRECFNKVGFFDESDKFKAVEDWDMWLRIAREYNVKIIQRPLVKIRLREDGLCSPSNAAKMLNNELEVLAKHFSYKRFLKSSLLLKRKAYSYRHYAAAIAYKEAKDLQNERRHIIKSLLLYPFDFFYKSHLVLILHALIGDKLFKRLESRC